MGSIASPSTFESSSPPVAPPAIQKRISLLSQTSQLSLHPSNPTAVFVKNACKAYSNGVPVLDDFGMSVPSGAIYSLLGASGCGKTTILSCIVGTLKLDSGDVFVFGQKPGTAGSGIPGRSVGYMPQGVTLYACLSIKETLEYFGRLYGMSNIEIQSRIEFLVNFLDLPSASQLVGTLSGGQQRRTSLAACLLHEPSLLILDEPTVGVDPLMRETIWNHLREITKKKQTTVIITTHYMEETKSSQKIGLMRNGRLLIEDSPRALLRAHNTNLLEDIVLQLCLKDEASHKRQTSFQIEDNSKPDLLKNDNQFLSKLTKLKFNKYHNQTEYNDEDETNVVGLTFKENPQNEFQSLPSSHSREYFPPHFIPSIRFQEATWFQKVFALFIRNIIIIRRNPLMLYFIFLFPTFHVLIINSTIGPIPKHAKFGVIIPEINYDLNVCKDIPGIGCDVDFWSCNYINLIVANSIIDPIPFRSIEEAIESIKQGQILGYMYFPQNYTKHLRFKFIAHQFATSESLDNCNIEIRMDNTNYFILKLLQNDLFQSFQNYTRELMATCDFPIHQSELAFKNVVIYGTIGSKFEEYVSPAVLVLITFIVPFGTTIYALINDRNGGTLDRAKVAGGTPLNILIAHFLSEAVLILIQTAISYSVVTFIFQWEIKGSTIVFLSLLILTAFAGVSTGTCLLQFIGDLYEAIFLTMGFFMNNLFFAALFWPLESTHWIIRAISCLFTGSWVNEAMRSLITRGWSVTHKNVWPAYASLAITILLTTIITLRLWRVRN